MYPQQLVAKEYPCTVVASTEVLSVAKRWHLHLHILVLIHVMYSPHINLPLGRMWSQ